MRVISGKKKGMRLYSTRDKFTRPTEDRIKESIFNVLKDIDENAYVLDLFSGSGGIGIEFLSRGAKFAVFSDISKINYNCIIDNLEHTDFLENSKVYIGDYIRNLNTIKMDSVFKFDYIFIDPPYEKVDFYFEAVDLIKSLELLNNNGIIILESEKELNLEKYNLIKTKKYGKKYIYFLDLGEEYENNLSR
ncbi:16S rRNA (guanine(966)-N(2))-methyltransferase RsmD [Miniphocaeibacter massiliensis]|uniref:16S rRNA (guanine(966)-N(2))-methyltransferase RsmD n=1 Tax=Miniphocaeibacter massiliensis TaxID=2041841 RepID=UPI000C07E640|nr:16S rRNA (guanine(966)-N(2))-methyltransferase RsmD [Miniphocaeibacter massiliensis]